MDFSYRAVLGAAFTQAWRCRKYPGKRRRDAFWRAAGLALLAVLSTASVGLFLIGLVLHMHGMRGTGTVIYDLFLMLVYAVLARFFYSVAAREMGDRNDKLPK